MRKLLILFMFVSLACQEEDGTRETPINDTFDPTKATLLRAGTFMGATGHTVSGTSALYLSEGNNVLYLSPFSSQNGPDLKVYLSKDQNASSYVNLGKLKSTTGMQSYAIPSNVNIEEYPYALVWCQQFSVLFGKAQMN